MRKIITFLLFAIQVVYMSLKVNYISCILTSKQVDKQGSDFQLYSDETPFFLVNGVAALTCHGWSLVSKGLAAHASANVTHHLIQERNWGLLQSRLSVL